MEKKNMSAVIARCLEGDSFAQEELVLAVQDRVYYHCRKILRDEDRAFDLTQDVLMAMLTKLDTLQNPESFWSWVGGITANLCRNAINRGPREVQIPEDEEGNSLLDTYETLDEQVIPDKALDNDETRRMIAELVDELPDAQRQCVLLYYYDEMSVKDIADTLAVSENTIKSRLNYARKAIKDGVKRYEKQGVKLYSASPLALLLFFLGRDAQVCGMTAEQAAELTQSVVRGVSAAAAGAGTAAAAAGGKAAAGASAAAKTGVLGVSTKVVAGVAAGAVIAGGAVGGILLTGDKDVGGPPSMDYLDPPAWVDYAFDEVEDFMIPGFEITVSDEGTWNQYGEPLRTCTYFISEDLYVGTHADVGSTKIKEAYMDGHRNTSLTTPIGWREICLGDSFEEVLEKLSLEDFDLERVYPEEAFPDGVPPEAISNIALHCNFYPNAPEKSHYSCGYFMDEEPGLKAVFIHYFDDTDEYRSEESKQYIVLWFEKDEKLTRLYYEDKTSSQQVSADVADENKT